MARRTMTVREYVVQTGYGARWFDANSSNIRFPDTPEGRAAALARADEFTSARVIRRTEQVIRESPLARAQRRSQEE